MNRLQLLEIALKTFNNRDPDRSQEYPRWGPNQPQARLEKEQFMYCKEKGHWKNVCPQHRKREDRDSI